jgi:hypothetical protein
LTWRPNGRFGVSLFAAVYWHSIPLRRGATELGRYVEMAFMTVRHLLCFSAMVGFAVFAGCDYVGQSAIQLNTTPEEAYRSFMMANLTGDESAIRPLILEHEAAHVLWQGAYPVEVAAVLSEQYRTMEISRVQSSGADDNDRVLLQSSAAPMPIAVVNVDGNWKVDAEPIIEFRKAAEKLEQP